MNPSPNPIPRPAVRAPRAVTHVTVVVPARNEERLLPRCLDALAAAARPAVVSGLRTRIVVVLDRCVDGTAQVAARAGAGTVASEYGAVGAARAVGAAEAIRAWEQAGVPLASAWLACTDADSTVPVDWVVGQAALAAAGADCVMGTVEPVGLSEALAGAWHRRHRLADDHAYVHGANVGVRASAYLDVGGFASLRHHEDVDLVRRLRMAGHRCVATDSVRVATSGRLRSRVEEGFAAYLSRLPGRPPRATFPPAGVGASAGVAAPAVSTVRSA